LTVEGSSSAEEFYSRCLSHALVLEQAAQRHAARDEVIPAIATAWGSDVFTAQAVLWERINVASRAPQRRFFEVAGQLASGIAGLGSAGLQAQTAYDVIVAARVGLLDACERSLRHRLEASWPEVEYLAGLPAPTDLELDEWVVERLGGTTAQDYVNRQRRLAERAMDDAQASRIRNEITEAVHGAYASDMHSLDAYLVESAVAAGDDYLITVPIRWETATQAVGQLAGLPAGFTAAVESIRSVMCIGIGEADGRRLQATFVPVLG